MTRFIIVAALHYAADVVTDYFQVMIVQCPSKPRV